eukprot:136630_1
MFFRLIVFVVDICTSVRVMVELDDEWFDKLEQLESWINIFTKRCTTECLRTVVDVADKIDEAVEYVIPEVVQLSKKERQIRTTYLRKIQNVKKFRKPLYENRFTQQIEKDAAKRDLMQYATKYEHEIIVIILKFRAAGFIAPEDPHHASTEEELKLLSPMEQRDRADAEFKKLYQDFHLPPPNLKRLRELEEQRYQKRKAMDKRIKEREMRTKAGLPEPPPQEAPKRSTMEWLTEEERKLRDELLEKEQKLTDAEKKWDEVERLKIPGTKARASMDKQQARLELLRFETSHTNQILSMKRKYKKQRATFPTNHHDVVLDDKARKEKEERQAMLREKLRQSGPAGKQMVEFGERLDREKAQRDMMRKALYKDKMIQNMAENVPVKKVDFKIYDDSAQETKEVEKPKYGASVKPKKNGLWGKMFKSKGKKREIKAEKPKEIKPEDQIIVGDEGVEAVLNGKQHAPAAAHMDMYDGLMDVYSYDMYQDGNVDQELLLHNNSNLMNELIVVGVVGLLVMIVLCFVCGLVIGAWSAWNGYGRNKVQDKSDANSGSMDECESQEI